MKIFKNSFYKNINSKFILNFHLLKLFSFKSQYLNKANEISKDFNEKIKTLSSGDLFKNENININLNLLSIPTDLELQNQVFLKEKNMNTDNEEEGNQTIFVVKKHKEIYDNISQQNTKHNVLIIKGPFGVGKKTSCIITLLALKQSKFNLVFYWDFKKNYFSEFNKKFVCEFLNCVNDFFSEESIKQFNDEELKIKDEILNSLDVLYSDSLENWAAIELVIKQTYYLANKKGYKLFYIFTSIDSSLQTQSLVSKYEKVLLKNSNWVLCNFQNNDIMLHYRYGKRVFDSYSTIIEKNIPFNLELQQATEQNLINSKIYKNFYSNPENINNLVNDYIKRKSLNIIYDYFNNEVTFLDFVKHYTNFVPFFTCIFLNCMNDQIDLLDDPDLINNLIDEYENRMRLVMLKELSIYKNYKIKPRSKKCIEYIFKELVDHEDKLIDEKSLESINEYIDNHLIYLDESRVKSHIPFIFDLL